MSFSDFSFSISIIQAKRIINHVKSLYDYINFKKIYISYKGMLVMEIICSLLTQRNDTIICSLLTQSRTLFIVLQQ